MTLEAGLVCAACECPIDASEVDLNDPPYYCRTCRSDIGADTDIDDMVLPDDEEPIG